MFNNIFFVVWLWIVSQFLFSVKIHVLLNSRFVDDILTPDLRDMKEHFRAEDLNFELETEELLTPPTKKELWPPSSQDLNPMDFSVWFMLKSLKVSFKAWAKIPHKKLCTAFESFRVRIECVITAERWHNEK